MSKAYGRLPETSEAFVYVAVCRLIVRTLARRSARPAHLGSVFLGERFEGQCDAVLPTVLTTDLSTLRRAFGFAFGGKPNRSIEDVAMMRTALLDVALMIILRRPKLRGRLYLGNDRRTMDPAAFQCCLRGTCCSFLVGVVGKYDRTVLAALFVWALIVQGGRIVQLPKDVQQLVVRNPRRVVAHFDHLYMPGRVGTYIVICGIVYRAAHISNSGSSYARELAEDLLNAPKATRTERRMLDGRHLTTLA
jgi:hypothetical protein